LVLQQNNYLQNVSRKTSLLHVVQSNVIANAYEISCHRQKFATCSSFNELFSVGNW